MLRKDRNNKLDEIVRNIEIFIIWKILVKFYLEVIINIILNKNNVFYYFFIIKNDTFILFHIYIILHVCIHKYMEFYRIY